MDVQYRYCPNTQGGVTEVRLDPGGDAAFVFAPHCQNASHLSFGIDEGGLLVQDIELTPGELDQLIAELQRARSGCFVGQWPRPLPPKIVLGDVRGLLVSELIEALQAAEPDAIVVC